MAEARGRARELVAAAAVGAFTLVCALEFSAVYGGGRVAIALAALVPFVAAGVALSLTRITGAVLWAAGLGAYVLFAGAVHFQDSTLVIVPTPGTLADLADALVNGWARMLSITPPLPTDGELLATATAAAWLGALGSAHLVWRTRTRLFPLVPPLLVYGVALMFEVPGQAARPMEVVILVGLAAAALVLRKPAQTFAAGHEGQGATEHRRRIGMIPLRPSVIVVALVLALLAPTVGPALPGADAREPFDPRRLQQVDINDRQAINPLVLVKGWLARPDEQLFRVETSHPVRYRLAVLDHYDGQAWTSAARFQPVGLRLPEIEVPPSAETASYRFAVSSLDTVWLPVAPEPIRVAGPDVVVDESGGVLAAPSGTVRELRYSVVSNVSLAPNVDYARSSIPSDVDDALLAVPGVPDEVRNLANEITSHTPWPIEKALAIETHLKTSGEFQHDPTAVGGQTWARVEKFLLGREDSGGKVGGTDQFAIAFATLARAAGLPTRVAVGFQLGREVEPGRYEVEGRHARAWTEVLVEGAGWVAFDPTPDATGAVPPPEEEEAAALEEEQQENLEGPVDETAPELEGPTEGSESDALLDGPVAKAVLALAVIALVLVGGGGAVALAKRRRRNRRRSIGSTRERVVAAWREVLDRLAEAGLRDVAPLTAEETVNAAQESFGPSVAPHLHPLGRRANEARYAPRDPLEEEVDAAWAESEGFLQVITAQRGRWERIRRAADPRPLVGARLRRR